MTPEVRKADRVLVIDDSYAIHELVKLRLRQEGLSVFSEYEGEPGIERAVAEQPDLILLDIGLPQVDGFEVCRRLKDNPKTSNIPIIFLTGTADTASKVKGLDLGAVDYVTKPFDEVELRARVRAALRTKRLQDILEYQSYIDGLTGLWNRAYLDQRLDAELDVSRRYDRSLSLLLGDIDHFKRLNDTYGHLFGDVALQGVGVCLREYSRRADIVTRYGGEEFAILLPDTQLEAAIVTAERLRAAIEAYSFEAHDERISVTMSFGLVCTRDLSSAPAPERMIGCADEALYAAKDSGRNCVFVMTRDGSPMASVDVSVCVAGEAPDRLDGSD